MRIPEYHPSEPPKEDQLPVERALAVCWANMGRSPMFEFLFHARFPGIPINSASILNENSFYRRSSPATLVCKVMQDRGFEVPPIRYAKPLTPDLVDVSTDIFVLYEEPQVIWILHPWAVRTARSVIALPMSDPSHEDRSEYPGSSFLSRLNHTFSILDDLISHKLTGIMQQVRNHKLDGQMLNGIIYPFGSPQLGGEFLPFPIIPSPNDPYYEM